MIYIYFLGLLCAVGVVPAALLLASTILAALAASKRLSWAWPVAAGVLFIASVGVMFLARSALRGLH